MRPFQWKGVDGMRSFTRGAFHNELGMQPVETTGDDGRPALAPAPAESYTHLRWVLDEPLAPGARLPRSIAGVSLLSPFDPVVWFRPRAERLFDFHYRIEIYVPAAKRRWGYYVLPFLLGERLVGRCDLKTDRGSRVLRVLGAFIEPEADLDEVAAGMTTELRRLAELVGVSGVSIDATGPLAERLRKQG